MLKGAKKLKVSGILLIISSALVILFFLITAVAMLSDSNAGDVFGDKKAKDGAGLMICFIVLFHLYKLFIGVLSVKRAQTKECKGVAGNAVLLLMMTLIWLVLIIVLLGMNAKASSAAAMFWIAVLIVLAVVDVRALIEIIIGTSQNSKGLMADPNQPWGPRPLTPFNYYQLYTNPDGSTLNQYGQQNGYGQPNPYGQANPYAQPDQFAQPNQFGQPMMNAGQGTQFGGAAQNVQTAQNDVNVNAAAPMQNVQNVQAQGVENAQSAQSAQNGGQQQDGEKQPRVFCNQDRFIDPRLTNYGQYFGGNGYAQYGQYGQYGGGAPQMPPMPPMNDTRL